MISIIRQAFVVFVALTIITGIGYPILVTVVAQAAFPHQANGSLITINGKLVGSELIGQQFDDPKYFWGRPSATSLSYNAAASTGSNLGPTNPAQLQAVKDRVEVLKNADQNQTSNVPIDLVTASGSGLDPQISPAAAEYQVSRISKARRLDAKELSRLVAEHTEGRTLGLMGEPRVNVLKLNMVLDRLNK